LALSFKELNQHRNHPAPMMTRIQFKNGRECFRNDIISDDKRAKLEAELLADELICCQSQSVTQTILSIISCLRILLIYQCIEHKQQKKAIEKNKILIQQNFQDKTKTKKVKRHQ
jgi:hypothetical protein